MDAAADLQVDDSISRFNAALESLRIEKDLSYRALAQRVAALASADRRLHPYVSSTFQAALKSEVRLPSRRLVVSVVAVLDPARGDEFLSRWRVLKGEVGPLPLAGEGPAVAESDSGSHQGRWLAVVVGLACVVVGGVASWPRDVGGIDAAGYCAKRAASFEHDSTYGSLRCVAGGVARPLDARAACLEQHPGWGPFGGAQFATPTGTGWGDWRCVGSFIRGS